MRITFRDFLTVGLGIGFILLTLENSELKGSNRFLKDALREEMEKSDRKNRYIGQILTEIKIKKNE